MDTVEYLAFIPLLIYGIAIADLLSEWKRFLKPVQAYLPYSITTFMLTETGIYNVYIYNSLIDDLVGLNYFTYLGYILSPCLFLVTVNTFTPETNADTRDYFHKQMPLFFFLASLFSASHFLYSFEESFEVIALRIFFLLLFLAIAITRKIWVFYVIVGFWVLHIFYRGLEMIN